MKRIKLLPSILMLVLCVGVLAVGIYAAAPVSHSINGTINVAAAGARVKIGVYADDLDGDYTDDTLVSNEVLDTRTAGTLTLKSDKISFNCDSATTTSDVADKNLYLKIENLSSIDLGAYFPVGEVASTGATAANVASVLNLNGQTEDNETLNDIVKCSFGPYTLVSSGAIAYIDLDLSLQKLSHFSAVTVELDLSINLENYNSNLAALANGVNVYTNATGATISTQTVTYGQTAGTALTATGIGYSVSALTLDQGNFGSEWGTDVKKNETTKLTFTVSNTGSAAVAADININNASYRSTELVVTELSNAYIPAGGTGEVSIQFTPTTTITDYSLDDICVDVDIYPATADATAQANLLGRIKTGTSYTGNMTHYIEYGVNPYNNNEPLRWFIWAQADSNGDPTTFDGSVEADSTYFFISEYLLDVTSSNYGLSFQNNYVQSGRNIYGEWNTDYAGSNYRNYVNGLSVKRSYTSSSSAYKADGAVVNFYDNFGLTNDALFSKISGYSGVATPTDKFWALSSSEYTTYLQGGYNSETRTYDGGIVYNLPKAEDTNSASGWWLRSDSIYDDKQTVDSNGGVGNDMVFYYYGSRPAFKIQL